MSLPRLELNLLRASNSANDWHKRHWGVYAGIKKFWYSTISAALAEAVGTTFPTPRWEVVESGTISILRTGPRLLDHDNLVGGVKPILDVMQCPPKGGQLYLGVFRNDDARMSLDVQQEVGEPGTKIVIERAA